MRYWCISTSGENWEIGKNNRIWGMDARYYITLERFLHAGDKAIVYTHGGLFRAIIEFAGEFYHSLDDIGWKKGKAKFLFPYRIKFQIVHESQNPLQIYYSTEEINNKAIKSRPNFIDNIIFIADKGKTWNQYLQVSIINITEEDFDTISREIANR
jgi:predicted RNA-binding protein